MPKRTTMNISITPQLSKFVNQRVKSGQFSSASEVVREGLRLMHQREAERQWLRKEVLKGLNQARRGQLLDGEQALADLEQSLFKKRRRKAG